MFALTLTLSRRERGLLDSKANTLDYYVHNDDNVHKVHLKTIGMSPSPWPSPGGRGEVS